MRFILKKIFTYQEHINYQTINITEKRSINKITRKKTEQIMIYIELKKQKKHHKTALERCRLQQIQINLSHTRE